MFQGCFCPVSEGLVRRNPSERSFPSVIVARQFIRMHFILCDVSLLAGDGVQCSCSVKVSTFWKKFYSYTITFLFVSQTSCHYNLQPSRCISNRLSSFENV